MAGVLDVDSDATGTDHIGDRLGDVFRGVAVAALDVGGDGHAGRGGDAADQVDDTIPVDLVAVGHAHAPGDAGTGRRDRGRAGLLDETCAGRVPDVRQDECVAGAVQCTEAQRPVAKGFIAHRD